MLCNSIYCTAIVLLVLSALHAYGSTVGYTIYTTQLLLCRASAIATHSYHRIYLLRITCGYCRYINSTSIVSATTRHYGYTLHSYHCYYCYTYTLHSYYSAEHLLLLLLLVATACYPLPRTTDDCCRYIYCTPLVSAITTVASYAIILCVAITTDGCCRYIYCGHIYIYMPFTSIHRS